MRSRSSHRSCCRTAFLWPPLPPIASRCLAHRFGRAMMFMYKSLFIYEFIRSVRHADHGGGGGYAARPGQRQLGRRLIVADPGGSPSTDPALETPDTA